MLIDKLNDKDKNTIESFIAAFGLNPYSNFYGTSRAISINHKLAHWANAKSEYLYRLLGNNLILEKEIEYIESPRQLAMRFESAMKYGGRMQSFSKIFRTWYNSDDNNYNIYSDEGTVLNALISTEVLSYDRMGDVKYIEPFLPVTINLRNGHKISIEKTTKPMRALGKLVKILNLDGEAFEEFRLEHSLIHNNKKVKGTLCLSIHPMDYMTMSTNSERWQTCMNWTEPGSYRGGTIEVMNSQMMVVAYLKSNEHKFFWDNGTNEWNSKKF